MGMRVWIARVATTPRNSNKQGVRVFQQVLIYMFLTATVSAQERPSNLGNCVGTTYGFVHISDETKNIAPIYCAASGYSDELAAVKNEEKWGYIDTDNNLVIGFEFDGAQRFHQGSAIVRQGNRYGLIDKNGEYTVPPVYHDLSLVEVAGQPYYIARDPSFFAGVIDQYGEEVIPHRFTYVIPLDRYENIRFYATFQDVDTTEYSFFEQFGEDPYRFSPEKGQLNLYDTQFDIVASRHTTNYTDGFQYYELLRIDTFLGEHSSLTPKEKVEGVAHVLTLAQPDEPQFNPDLMGHPRMEGDALNRHMDSLGYAFFSDANGKMGVKKSGDPLIPAHYKRLEFAHVIIPLPSEEDAAYLKENYAANYQDEKKKSLGIFFILTFDESSGKMGLYDLHGNKVLPTEATDFPAGSILAGTTPLGFQFLVPSKNDTSPTGTLGLINWKGVDLLSPNFTQIDVSPKGHILATAENKKNPASEGDMGLFDDTGHPIIPMGTYATIRPLGQADNMLYLATANRALTEEGTVRDETNQTYDILLVSGKSYDITNQFKASQVSVWAVDNESGMLIYVQAQDE